MAAANSGADFAVAVCVGYCGLPIFFQRFKRVAVCCIDAINSNARALGRNALELQRHGLRLAVEPGLTIFQTASTSDPSFALVTSTSGLLFSMR